MKPSTTRHLHCLAAAFRLLQKNLATSGHNLTQDKLRDDENKFSRIRCPVCRWQPSASSRWICGSSGGPPEYFSGGCYTRWNTFDTHGLCPGCQYQWRWTVCLKCHAWSLHDDWYSREATPHFQ